MADQDVNVLDQNDVYQGFFTLRRYRLQHRLFAGGMSESVEREVLLGRDAVAVLLYDPVRCEVVLIEQFRAGLYAHGGVSPWSLEVVAGLIEPAQSIEETAQREVSEEAGLSIRALEPIAQYWPTPGYSREQIHLFCGCVDATQAGGVFGLATEHEDIKVRVFSCQDAFALLAKRAVQNAMTLIALQWLQAQQARLDAQWKVL